MMKSFGWLLLFSAITICINAGDVTNAPSDILVTLEDSVASKPYTIQNDDPETETSHIPQDEMAQLLADYDRESIKVFNHHMKSMWAVSTDVGNKEKEKQKVR